MVRSLASTLENTGSHSGEEYLQPHSRTPISISGLSSLSTSPPSARMRFWPATSHTMSDGSCAPQNQHNWNQERLRYAKAHGLDPSSIRMGNNSNCSSLKFRDNSMNGFRKDHVGSDEYDSSRPQAQIGTLKLELPLDEDDYLMPSPQGQGPTTYVDLIGESKSCDSGCDAMYRSYPDFCKTNIDNPEYLMGNETPPCQTLGIPTVSEYVHANSSNTNKNPSHLPHKISEEESDHEYYNDFDRLRRELQPLQSKGETTV